MIYTNNHNLPEAFYRAVVNDPYDRGDSDFSATGLAQPPRAIVLFEENKDSIRIDVSTRVAATIGQGVHSILERAQREHKDIIETRYAYEFTVDDEPYIVSAQIDLYEKDSFTLFDWKTTKAYAFHSKVATKFEYEAQMNVGAYLMIKNLGCRIDQLKIIGLLKDWDYKLAQTEPGYPTYEIMTMDIPIWTDDKIVSYIEERIRAIVEARKELPLCTKKETWGGRRCERYCDSASVCIQYQESKRAWPK